MGPNRITPGGATRRAFARLAAPAVATVLVLSALAGCGGGSSSTGASATAAAAARKTVPPEKAADAAVLNTVLAREEAAVRAFAGAIAGLPPRLARTAAYLRAQEQEHVDAVLKAMRGLGLPAEPAEEAIEPTAPLRTDRERLTFLYEIESASIDDGLAAIGKLEASWPRSLLASVVANQAQHLVLLRQELGAGPLASVPVPFENGTAEPPE
jgi:hypothetical protein